MNHIPFIIFFFAAGACVGSFLNVIVWRLPRGESIVHPRSRCPKCGTQLAWYDNIPVIAWIALRGKCRYCRQPVSIRYPIFEALTGGLFVLYYVALFVYQQGPCHELRDMTIQQDWPLYLIYVLLIAGMLASSLIDAEHYIIPLEIPWSVAGVALLVHTVTDTPLAPGSLNASAPVAALALGAGVGLLSSIALMQMKILPQSFEEGGPLLEHEKQTLAAQGGEAPVPEFTAAQIRVEMRKEMLFLMPPLILGAAWLLMTWKIPAINRLWNSLLAYHWFSALLGSLWGALVGGYIIWLTRLLGSMAFGREAMGLGDVHLMLGIGAALGAAGAVIVFFLAPFFGLLFALYKLIVRRGREVPYGPYLSLAAAVVVLSYCRLIQYFGPPMTQLVFVLRQKLAGE